MMQAGRARPLSDRAAIEAFLRRAPDLHVYSLGDLDDFFWPHTSWHGWYEGDDLTDIVLLYFGQALPTVVAISQQPQVAQLLLAELVPLLPRLFYAHLSPGVEGVFRGSHVAEFHGPHYKMALRDPSRVRGIDCSQTLRLGKDDLADLSQLYQTSYPGNWFDAKMLETEQYFGLRRDGRLVSVAGVHAYSRQYRVAALGNIVTHPAYRRRGCGRQVIARLCQSVLENAEHVGLNVKADNEAAIACYRSLGFEIVAPYGEFTVSKRA